MPGGILSLSADGNKDGSAIVWGYHALTDNSSGEAIVDGRFHAYDARDLRELWDSSAQPRDAVGLYGKFCPPTIANGRVYIATFSNMLQVYGLLKK